MRKGMPSKRAGRKFSDKEHYHVGVRLYPSEKEKLKYLFSASGKKSVSAYIIALLLDYKGNPKNREKQPGVHTDNFSLCVPYKEQWNIIKQKAEDAGMSISGYIASVIAEQ